MGATHGLASTYRNKRYKCRCDDCREANSRRCQEGKQARAERLAADPSLAPHGKKSTYNNWGCRCASCSKANADACRAWKSAWKEP